MEEIEKADYEERLRRILEGEDYLEGENMGIPSRRRDSVTYMEVDKLEVKKIVSGEDQKIEEKTLKELILPVL